MKKKWLIIGIVILVIGGLIGFFAARAGSPGPTAGKTETAGTIKVPDGPKIKVVFTGPPELKMSWEKLGMEGFALHLIGTLRNVSNQKVSFEEVAFLIDGHQVDYMGRFTGLSKSSLEPGEEMKIMRGFAGYTENSKVLEVKIKGFQTAGGTAAPPAAPPTPTTSPKPTPPPATTEPAPTTQPSSAGTIFTAAPKNPQSPEEVVAAFYFLVKEEKYSEALKLVSPKVIAKERLTPEVLRQKPEASILRKLESIKIIEVDIYEKALVSALVSMTVYYKDGSGEGTYVSLIKEEGGWKLVE